MGVICSKSYNSISVKKKIFERQVVFVVEAEGDLLEGVVDKIMNEAEMLDMKYERLNKEDNQKGQAVKVWKSFSCQSVLKSESSEFDAAVEDIAQECSEYAKDQTMIRETKTRLGITAKFSIDELAFLCNDQLVPIMRTAASECYKVIDGFMKKSTEIHDGVVSRDFSEAMLRVVSKPLLGPFSERILDGSETVRLSIDEQLLNRVCMDLISKKQEDSEAREVSESSSITKAEV